MLEICRGKLDQIKLYYAANIINCMLVYYSLFVLLGELEQHYQASDLNPEFHTGYTV